MENQNIKRSRGRPLVYETDEERKEAVKKSKTKYMGNKEWYCDICKNGKNYKLGGKWCHLKTMKHQLNSNK